jgi:hypothetical protein
MIAATLIATIAKVDMILESTADMEEDDDEPDQGMAAEAEQYLNGQSGQSVSL